MKFVGRSRPDLRHFELVLRERQLFVGSNRRREMIDLLQQRGCALSTRSGDVRERVDQTVCPAVDKFALSADRYR
jgi:hypothetical protein